MQQPSRTPPALFDAEHDAAILASHVGILGKTGSGKSNLAKVIAERLLDQGERVCIIDPTGTWYGLRLQPPVRKGWDPKPSAYKPVIFGGAHGDMPISEGHGAAIAEAIGRSTTSAIIDTRAMTVRARTEFATAFAETLLQRNAGTLHVIVDEAHLFAPQGRVQDPRSGAMLGAWSNLVALGRGVGLRIVMLSQRPAKLHKDALTQIETLVTLRLIAPQDTAAVQDWIGEWAGKGQGGEVIRSLPSLPTGRGWVWSPEVGLLGQRDFPLASTLDTGKPSANAVALEPIDLEAIQAQLGKVEEDRKANDPTELRKLLRSNTAEAAATITALERKIAALERQLATRPPETVERIVEVIPERVHAAMTTILAAYRTLGDRVHADLNRVHAETIAEAERLEALGAAVMDQAAAGAKAPSPEVLGRVQRVNADGTADVLIAPATDPAMRRLAMRADTRALAAQDDGELGPVKDAEVRLLEVLARNRRSRLSRPQLGVLAKLAWKGGAFAGHFYRLRRRGFITEATGLVSITDAGLDAIGRPPEQDPTTTAEVIEAWGEVIGAAGRRMVDALVAEHPEGLDREALAFAASLSPKGGAFAGALGTLARNGLAERRDGKVYAGASLFPG